MRTMNIALVSNLYSLNESKLDELLTMNDVDKNAIIYQLISHHFPKIDTLSSEYEQLVSSYKSSWLLEKIYRNNLILRSNYKIIYLKSGIIREIINGTYYLPESLTLN